MTRQLWAPWRLEYVGSADEQDGCIFCKALAAADEESLVVHRGEAAFVLLNRFPYASGHLMVAPARHVGELGDLEDAEVLEVHRLASQGLGALAETYKPQGFNLGWNLGRIAGAGVTDHVHLHGYDVMRNVAPGQPARFAFRATIVGRVEVELEDSGVPLARITTQP